MLRAVEEEGRGFGILTCAHPLCKSLQIASVYANLVLKQCSCQCRLVQISTSLKALFIANAITDAFDWSFLLEVYKQ